MLNVTSKGYKIKSYFPRMHCRLRCTGHVLKMYANDWWKPWVSRTNVLFYPETQQPWRECACFQNISHVLGRSSLLNCEKVPALCQLFYVTSSMTKDKWASVVIVCALSLSLENADQTSRPKDAYLVCFSFVHKSGHNRNFTLNTEKQRFFHT